MTNQGTCSTGSLRLLGDHEIVEVALAAAADVAMMADDELQARGLAVADGDDDVVGDVGPGSRIAGTARDLQEKLLAARGLERSAANWSRISFRGAAEIVRPTAWRLELASFASQIAERHGPS